VIRAAELTKDYGLRRAVDRISFQIERGDVVGLLGPNGSGKTTVMRMLTGFFAPTSGSCAVAGIDLAEAPREARRCIGYLPERVALYPDMTVRSYLRFVASVHEVAISGAAADEAMERCGLVDVAKRRIGKLSKGYRQRVGIAQAIIHRPAVLILDEPTVGLDPRQIVEIRTLIRKLAGSATVLLSTHILPEVSITCRRVLILDQGKLVAEDTAEGLTARTMGQGKTLVRVRAPMRDAIVALSTCPGASDARVVDRDPTGMVSLVVTSDGKSDPAPMIARLVTERGWTLHELTHQTISLEDLFVRILEGNDGGPERQ
jgi:ABC-2 type transport system ATP-binding protein